MTPQQRRNVQLYLHFRDQPMTLGRLLWAVRRVYIKQFLAFAVLAAIFYFAFGEMGAGLVAAVLVIVLLRDLAFYRNTIRFWPLLREVLD